MKKKLTILLLLLVASVPSLWASATGDDEPSLTIATVKAKRGDTVQLVVSLHNPGIVCHGLQFDLALPDSVSLHVDRRGQCDYELSGRCVGRSPSLMIGPAKDGVLRLLLFSLSAFEIEGDDGPVLTLPVDISPLAKRGIHTGHVRQVIAVEADGHSVAIPDAPFTIKVRR